MGRAGLKPRIWARGWFIALTALAGCAEEDRYWVPLGADARSFAVEAVSIDPWYDDFGDTVVPFPVYTENFIETGGEVDRLGARYFFDSLYLDVCAWTVPSGNDLADGKKDYVRIRFAEQPEGTVLLESVFQLFPRFQDSTNSEFSSDTLRWNDRAFYRVYRLSDPSASRMEALIDSTGQLLGFQTIDSLIYFREAP